MTWVLDKIPACFYIEEDETVEALLQLFTRLHSYTAGADWSAERAVESNRLLLEILKILLGMCREGDKPQPVNHIIRQAYRYMDRHYCENCPLSKIAEAVHLSANHLHQMFLKSEGFTPYEYVMGKRIEKAKTFILTGDRSLAQIALETGFCSQSHFTAIFKKHTGQTPAQYRTQLFSFS